MLHLTKHHGLGNDFLVALAADNPVLTPDHATVAHLCDRRRGVGADGVIYGLEPADPGHDACMVLVNSDGSEAEISGNGLRCLAQALLASAGQREGTVTIETSAGVRTVRTVRGDVDGELWSQVDMGAAAAGPDPGPSVAEVAALDVATVDLGNPHLVLRVADPDELDLSEVGPRLQADYASGINVHLVAVDARDHLRLRVWERGAGPTEACGSGAAAAVAAAARWGLVGDTVEVDMPGGRALVELSDDHLLLTGPSVMVARVEVP